MVLDYTLIGRRIKEIRLKNSLTQEKLAERCNLSASYISLVETANREASLESLVSLANNLGVTVNEFLKGYQINDVITYNSDFALLIDDCNCYERQIIYDVVANTKKSLQDNNHLYYMSKS